MEYKEFKQAVIQAAKAAAVEEYELYYQTSSETNIEIYKQEVKSFSGGTKGGVCFRCIINGKMGYAATQLFEIEEAALLVDRAVDNARSIESTDEVFIYPVGDRYQQVTTKPTELPPSELLVSKAIECNKATYAMDPLVKDGTESGTFAEKAEISIHNSKGLDLSQETSLAGVYTIAIVGDEQEMVDEFGFELGDISLINVETIAAKAVKGALSQVGAGSVVSGKYKVVFSGKMIASMFATFSSVFSADNVQKGLSLLKGKVNQPIGSKALTVIDDPFYEGSTTQMPFDAEGVATYTKEVIKEGVLSTLLHNLKTAKKDGVKSTGNASKAGYSANVGISPFCFYVKPGQQSRDELFANVGEGIFITDLQGMHSGANPQTGDFSLAASGFLIENGKKTKCVKGFTIAGNFFDLLNLMEVVGNDLEFGLPRGLCSFGAPSVVVSELSVAGQ
jgi:PmbA protein